MNPSRTCLTESRICTCLDPLLVALVFESSACGRDFAEYALDGPKEHKPYPKSELDSDSAFPELPIIIVDGSLVSLMNKEVGTRS